VLGRAITDIEQMFGVRANAVTEALEQRTRDFNDVLGARTGELASLLDGRSNTFIRTLDQTGNAVVDLVANRSEEAARTLLNTGERVAASFATTNAALKTDVTEVADRLQRSNDVLNGLLATTADNLGKIETQLGARSNEFRAAVGHAIEATQLSSNELSGQLGKLREASREIVEGVGTVVKRFEEQSVSLSGATKNLSDVNRQIQTTVEERRPALEALTVGLKARSEELEGLMKSFTRIIAETLKTAEERATAVSRMLTENTATATKGVIDHFENMNRTAGSESRKAADAVREANKSLINDMGSAITEVSKRFAEATRDMRQATQEVQRDLSITREELRRGVLELPEEAREGAEAMRRVVGDQIKALTELSEIINRHGKNFDLSSPTLGEPRIRIDAAAAVNAEPVSSAYDSGAAQARYSPAPEPRRASNGAMNVSPALAPMAKAPPRAVPRQAPTALRPTTSDEAGEGWVSDLLRRASTEEDESANDRHNEVVVAESNTALAVAPTTSPTSLGALSADIARAIDHDAAVELWARHNKGEKNLFTRRLYTLSGQQTFDEIRKKYQRDGDFSTAVDRYVADFEKLLSEVTKAGKDRAAASAYLTSDTGKVYTMLAHASGHFD
jgi:ABC-type transporter Mla subunit MlaD